MSIFKNLNLKRSLEQQFSQVISLIIDGNTISSKAIIDDVEIVVFKNETEVIERQKVASIFTTELARKPRSGDLLTWNGIDYRLNKLLHEDFNEVRFSLVKIGTGAASRASIFDLNTNAAKLGQLAIFGEVISLNINGNTVSSKAIIDDVEVIVFKNETEVIERQKVASIFTTELARKPRSGDLLTWNGIDYRLNKLLHEDFNEVRFSLAFDVVPVTAITNLGDLVTHLGAYVTNG